MSHDFESIESRLGRMEGMLNTYTSTVTGILDRMEKRQSKLEDTVTGLRLSRARTTGVMAALSGGVSAAVALIVAYFRQGS